MVRDRLQEFKEKIENETETKPKRSKWKKQKKDKNGTDLEKLLAQIEDLRKLVRSLEEGTSIAKAYYDTAIINPLLEKDSAEKLNNVNKRVKKTANDIHGKLKCLLSAENIANSSLLKTAKTQHAVLLKDFLQVMHDFQKKQIEHEDRRKALLKLGAEIGGYQGGLDDLDGNQEHFLVFTQNILLDSAEARKNLEYVTERHADISKVEKSLQEIHDLFFELALLVQSQGEMVDKIETNIEHTLATTESGKDHLHEANRKKKKLRKMKATIAAVCGTIIATTITLIVLL